PNSIFNDASIDAFAASINFPLSAAGRLQSINEQYYITSFLDGYEPHANWRRSGYPLLTPVNFQGNYTSGVIPRRFQYPASEQGLNGANLNEAIARQGPNTWTTRVWWDGN
ncbi:MAG: SusD/RagB family nutrient-binding outer membrane lipoprotein, partial [Daejeonella sp.]